MRLIFNKNNLFFWLFWLLYVLYGVMDSRSWIMQKGFLWSLQPLLLFLAMIAFLLYLNVRVLIPLLLENKKYGLYALGIGFIILAYTYFRSLNQQFWDSQVWPNDIMAIDSYFYWNSINAVWFLVISTLLFYAQKWLAQQQAMKNIQISQLETELKYLRTQMNPHFLFNGLNTIYGTIEMENTTARDMVVQFADLLRYHLYEADTDFVAIGKEATYLQNYMALQRARSNTGLLISSEIRIENPDREIAPLLFMAFVENAFKYSTRDDGQESRVEVSLVQQGDAVVFNCINSFEATEALSGGIGLTNVKRRLELLYQGRYEMNITREDAIFKVYLKLTL